jgi:glycogen phosphorylase
VRLGHRPRRGVRRHEYQDTVESQALYNLLENEIIPCFYDRPFGDLPARWIKMMKASIRMALGYFTSHRMVAEYRDELLRARHRGIRAADRRRRPRWPRARGQQHAPPAKRSGHGVRIAARRPTARSPPARRRPLHGHHRVHLGELTPEEVDVQVYYGPVDSQNRIVGSHVEAWRWSRPGPRATTYYRCEHRPARPAAATASRCRVTPAATNGKCIMPGFVTWADGT